MQSTTRGCFSDRGCSSSERTVVAARIGTRRGRAVTSVAASSSSSYELLFCTHKTCKRSGSEQVLKFVQDLGLPNVTGSATGCLGHCGKGPNAVLLHTSAQGDGVEVLPQQQLQHVTTPSAVVQVLKAFCDAGIDAMVLEATQLRLSGNSFAVQGDLPKAIEAYTQALALPLASGRHLLHSNRSAARLQSGRLEEALQDAKQAVALAPPGFHNAWIRLIDAHYALGQHGEAAEACRKAAQTDSSFRFANEFKQIRQALAAAGHKV